MIHQPTFIAAADDLRAGTLVAINPDQPTIELAGIHAVILPNREHCDPLCTEPPRDSGF